MPQNAPGAAQQIVGPARRRRGWGRPHGAAEDLGIVVPGGADLGQQAGQDLRSRLLDFVRAKDFSEFPPDR